MTVNSKLTEEDIIHIYTGIEHRMQAAVMFDVHPTSIDRIRAGKWHKKITKNLIVLETVKTERDKGITTVWQKTKCPVFIKPEQVEAEEVRDILPELWGGMFMWLKGSPDTKKVYKKAKGTCYGIS